MPWLLKATFSSDSQARATIRQECGLIMILLLLLILLYLQHMIYMVHYMYHTKNRHIP